MDTIYIHTLDGYPAMFDGERVCFASQHGRPNRPATSLRQIRREQQASIRWDREQDIEGEWEYGYRRYSVEPQPINHHRTDRK